MLTTALHSKLSEALQKLCVMNWPQYFAKKWLKTSVTFTNSIKTPVRMTPNLICRLVPHTKLSCLVQKDYIFRVITETRVNDNKVVHQCFVFFLEQICILMVHEVQHPDIVHKCSWKGCTVRTEQCGNRHQHTAFMHKIGAEVETLQNTVQYSLFSACWGNINAKKPIFFFKCHHLRLTDTLVYLSEWLIISLMLFYRFISLLRLCIIHLRIINFTRRRMEIYSLFGMFVLRRLSR